MFTLRSFLTATSLILVASNFLPLLAIGKPALENLDDALASQKAVQIVELPLEVVFSAGKSIAFVGATRNGAPANDGWTPSGLPLNGKVGHWLDSQMSPMNNNSMSGRIRRSDNDFLPGDSGLDFLFCLKGLQERPSIDFQLGSVRPSYSLPPIGEPYNFRVSISDRTKLNPEMVIRFTDEPWGKYVRIDPFGNVLNPIQPDDRHASAYKLIEALGSVRETSSSTGKGILFRKKLLNGLDSEQNRFDFEMRGVDTEGNALQATTHSGFSDGKKYQASIWKLALRLPKGVMLSHYEYRLRPYRYRVAFRGVSTSPGTTTEATVSWKTLQIEDEQAPVPERAKISFFLLGKIDLHATGRDDTSTTTMKIWEKEGEVAYQLDANVRYIVVGDAFDNQDLEETNFRSNILKKAKVLGVLTLSCAKLRELLKIPLRIQQQTL